MSLLVRILIAILIIAVAVWLLPMIGLPHTIYLIILLIVVVLTLLWAFGRLGSLP